MVERSPAVAAVLVVLAAVGAVPVAALSDAGVGSQQTTTGAANETNESLAPGERLAGVVGVEAAEIEGELEARTFGQRVAAAKANASAAGIVAAEVDDLEERLTELDARLRELERAHENGTLNEGEYRARLAQFHARQRTLQRQINQTEYVARELPAAALEARGVDVGAIETLRSQASELSGPEVAAVARSIAGKNAGTGMGGPPEHAGPPAFVQNRTGGPPADAGPGNQTGPPSDAGPGNETGQAADGGNDGSTGGNEGNGDGPNGNGDGDGYADLASVQSVVGPSDRP